MNGYDSLQKFEVPEIIHGLGAMGIAGQCAKRLGGERVLLVTDPGVIHAGWVDEAVGYLRAEGLKYVVYDNVVTNPRDFHVEEGARVYEKQECDVIVAVGGGSPIDTAKGIAILVSNHGCIHDYEGCNLVTQPVPPLVCIPTTAGTGADVTQMAVVTHSEKRMKMVILGRAIMPEISLIDPRLLQTESSELIAATGMDTLTHAIEAYVSSLSWTLTDPHAIHAIELVSEHLVHAARYKDIKSLDGMSIACLEAGIAFSNAILGAVHALAHPLGGFYDIHHGLANAILLPTVVRRNMEYSLDKYARIARAMGVDTNGMSLETAASSSLLAITKLIEDLGLPSRLSEFNVNPDDISLLADLAKDDMCMRTNPYCYSKDEIETLYREAL
ncbi:MAG: iron-containing alcohol dehydrogenase [Syntrophobacteraceae bacterium]|nr:iron-containing alcohol dehydrogenase [Syntrophobacteraceae bacterium]